MSSTGRGPRLGGDDDFYVTPAWAVHRLLEAVDLPGGTWVEPAAGNGAIVRAVDAYHTRNTSPRRVNWHAWEIREEESAALLETRATFRIADFLAHADEPVVDVTVCIGNPPYSLAQEFIEKARAQFPNAIVCFLLRLNFVGSEKRAAFMRANPPDIATLPNRPSFTGGPTDSIEYGWFMWRPGARSVGTFRVLGLTSLEARKAENDRIKRQLAKLTTEAA